MKLTITIEVKREEDAAPPESKAADVPSRPSNVALPVTPDCGARLPDYNVPGYW